MPDASWRVGFGLFAQSRVGRQQDSEHVPCCVTCDASPGRLRFIVYFRIYVAERKRNTYVRGGPARDPGPFLSARPAKRRCIPHEVVYDTRLAGSGRGRTAGPTTPTPSIHPASDHCPGVPPITFPFRETDRHNHHDQPDHVHEHRPDGPRGPTPTFSDDLQECIAVACTSTASGRRRQTR